jgi:hypothetical protein
MRADAIALSGRIYNKWKIPLWQCGARAGCDRGYIQKIVQTWPRQDDVILLPHFISSPIFAAGSPLVDIWAIALYMYTRREGMQVLSLSL